MNEGELSKRIDDPHRRLDDLRADTNRRFEELRADMNQRFHTLTRLTSVWFSLLTILFKFIRYTEEAPCNHAAKHPSWRDGNVQISAGGAWWGKALDTFVEAGLTFLEAGTLPKCWSGGPTRMNECEKEGRSHNGE